jgi:hypothetical protein
MKRQCGDCQLCCRLVPVQSLAKPGGTRCRFQKFGKGCAVYHQPQMPPECSIWSCRWLVNDDAAELARPDRSHYVIDMVPDFITIKPHDGSAPQNMQVAQIWIDPKYPDAHRDPALRRWMVRRAEQGIAAIIRSSEREAFVVFAPPFDAAGGEWHEIRSDMRPGPSHSLAETVQALGGAVSVVIEP